MAQMLKHRTGQGLDLCLSISCSQHAWLVTSPMHDVFEVTDAFEATRLFTMEKIAQKWRRVEMYRYRSTLWWWLGEEEGVGMVAFARKLVIIIRLQIGYQAAILRTFSELLSGCSTAPPLIRRILKTRQSQDLVAQGCATLHGSRCRWRSVSRVCQEEAGRKYMVHRPSLSAPSSSLKSHAPYDHETNRVSSPR